MQKVKVFAEDGSYLGNWMLPACLMIGDNILATFECCDREYKDTLVTVSGRRMREGDTMEIIVDF